MQYHCIDFFTNVDELALTLGSLSDADLYVAREVSRLLPFSIIHAAALWLSLLLVIIATDWDLISV